MRIITLPGKYKTQQFYHKIRKIFPCTIICCIWSQTPQLCSDVIKHYAFTRNAELHRRFNCISYLSQKMCWCGTTKLQWKYQPPSTTQKHISSTMLHKPPCSWCDIMHFKMQSTHFEQPVEHLLIICFALCTSTTII